MLYYIGSSFDSSQSSTMNPFNVFTQLMPPASIEIPNTQTSQSDPSKLFKWDDNDVRLLIESYSQHKQLLKKGKLTKKQLFERVAHHFNTKSKVIVSGEQCLRKWNKLVQKYKEVEDNNKRTGRANKDWKYMDSMAECMGDSPNVNPAYTFDTSSSSPSPSACSLETTNDDNEDVTSDDEQNKDVKKPVTRKRKRKSNSSASEMLSFLKDYSEKREKDEEKKVELLRKMHEEKTQFFSQFLEVMKKK